MTLNLPTPARNLYKFIFSNSHSQHFQSTKMSSEQNLPERPAADVPAAEGAEGGEKLSKKALKKLEKEREKVESTNCTY